MCMGRWGERREVLSDLSSSVLWPSCALRTGPATLVWCLVYKPLLSSFAQVLLNHLGAQVGKCEQKIRCPLYFSFTIGKT